MSNEYIHGYSEKEQERLIEQSSFLENMLFESINFSDCNHVLEVGCGVGANLIVLLKHYPDLKVSGIDIDARQIEMAHQNLQQAGLDGRYTLQVADATEFELTEKADGVLFCWMLEHTNNAIDILKHTKTQALPNSPVFLNEVYNNGFYIQPALPNILKYFDAFNAGQQAANGDVTAGVKLGYHLHAAGYNNIDVQQICQFHDVRDKAKRSVMVDYLKDLLFSAKDNLLASNRIEQATIDGMSDEFEALRNREDAIIFYPGFQASART